MKFRAGRNAGRCYFRRRTLVMEISEWMPLSSPRTDRASSSLLVIDGVTVAALVSQDEARELAEAALSKTSSGLARQDVRRTLDLPGEAGTCLSVMYASVADRMHAGAK